MIKYSLQCGFGHQFEGWFSNSADYDAQSEKGLLTCPSCGSVEVEKALMAPAVKTGRKADAQAAARLSSIRDAINQSALKARDYVEKNFDHVGKTFPEEARKIHYGEVDARPIYGEATLNEVRELKDEGVEIAPVPAPIADDPKSDLN